MGGFSLINRTRIFLSSAFEEDLKSPRKIIKNHLEESGHEVPIFEDGDFGSWEKNTINQCLDVVRTCDVFVLLINKKASADQKLLPGDVTPTYLEYKAAVFEKKHILVFVTPEVKKTFMSLKDELKNLYEGYIKDHHRSPDSPFDPVKPWVDTHIEKEGPMKRFLEIADPFIWAFLYDIYRNGSWLYEYDISRTEQQAKSISAMLSTSLRSVVSLIPQREKLELLEKQASSLLKYADYTLIMVNEKNLIMNKSNEDWSSLLEQGIRFFDEPKLIIQAPDFNPEIVNTLEACYAASLYKHNDPNGNVLSLIGTTGDITPRDFFLLDENDVFVVDAFNHQERLIAYREDKNTIYLAEPLDGYVLCLHFSLTGKWTNEKVKAYIEEIEYAIINEHEYFLEFFKLLIGGKT